MVSGFRFQLPSTLDPRPLIPPSSLDTRPFLLLPRQVPAQFGLFVLDQLAAHVHGYFVNLTRKRERRLVLRRDGRACVRSADYGAEQSDGERIGQRDVALSDQLAVDIELALARRAFAGSDVGFGRHLEWER